jgi:nucleoside-diphosphate-sugar epimerase
LPIYPATGSQPAHRLMQILNRWWSWCCVGGESAYNPDQSGVEDNHCMPAVAITNWSGYPLAAIAGSRALVTGGAGFIGSHLTHALMQLGASVTVIDDLSGGGDPNQLPAAARFVRGSILDLPLLDECVTGCQFIFHQAALGSVPRSLEQPRSYHDANTTGTLNVLEAARSAGVKRVMFAASSAAYGDNPTLPKTESMPTSPRSPYAANKVAGEAMLAAWAASYGLDTVSLRYFNIFGPRQNPNSAYAAVIAAFAKSLLANQRPLIFGDGEQSRDFTYVDNVVLANLLAACSPRPLAGAIINIACGRRISVNQLAQQMASLLNRSHLTPEYRTERAGDVKHSLADLTAARTLLAYEPAVDFETGIAATVKWYASVLG